MVYEALTNILYTFSRTFLHIACMIHGKKNAMLDCIPPLLKTKRYVSRLFANLHRSLIVKDHSRVVGIFVHLTLRNGLELKGGSGQLIGLVCKLIRV